LDSNHFYAIDEKSEQEYGSNTRRMAKP